MKARGEELESRIEQLEFLVSGFSERVQEVSREYQGLKTQIYHVSEEFEALEDDHMVALDALDAERETAEEYLERLRTTEVEIYNLYQSLNPRSD